MASITSAAHGFWEAGSTWTGGVVPVENDKVTITHTVEISGGVAITAGDDTTTAININGNGALKFSRVRNTDFTAKGQIVVANNGTFDCGTIASPIPNGVTSTIRLNKSAAMAVVKYGFNSANGGIVHIHGAALTRNTKLNGALVGGETTIYVDDATGWNPGDKIFIGPTELSTTTVTRADFLTIHSGYTPGSTTVTLTSAVLYPHMDNVVVSNLSSNVLITNYDATGVYRGSFSINWGNLNSASECTLRYCRFDGIGNNGSLPPLVGLDIRASSVAYNTPQVWNDIIGIASGFSASAGGGFAFSSHSSAPAINITDCAFVTQYGYSMNFSSGTVFNITRCSLYAASYVLINTAYSEGGKGVIFNDCDCMAQNGAFIFGHTGLSFTFNTCRFFGRGYMFSGAAMPGHTFNNCDIGYTFPLFLATTGINIIGAGGINRVSQFTLNDCMVGSNQGYFNVSPSVTDFGENNAASYLLFKNKNTLATSQELQVPNGYMFRDNSEIYRSSSSMMFQPLNTSIPLTQAMVVDAPNNVPVTVIGYLKFNTAWGTATPPSVTLDGLGIVPYTFTAASSGANNWQKFEVTKTQNSGVDGTLLLTFSGATSAANGNIVGSNVCQAWLSGVVNGDFVVATRHYGYLFDGNTSRGVNSKISESDEVVVGARLTTDTLDQLYDRLELWGVENPNTDLFYSYTGNILDLGSTNLIVDTLAPSGAFSYDGSNVTIKTNILATGTNFTKIKTSGTITESNGAIVSSLYEDYIGPSSKLVIHLPLSDMALDLHNISTDTELVYLPSVSGTYELIIAPISGSDDTWKWVLNRQGYVSANASFNPKNGGLFEYFPDTPQVLTPEGLPMYTGTSSPLVTISTSGATSYIDIGNGTPSLQNIFDLYEDFSVTSLGMDWILNGNDGVRIFESPAGNYLFETAGIRLRRRETTDVNATIPGFVQSVDGIPVDESNGPIRYLTSDSSESIANAVWQNLTALAMTQNITSIDKLSKLIPAAL